jgi:ADP-heptose:LPS heptosyltransferase
MPESPLLIVHPGALGDVVGLFPIMRALRRTYRPVTILCQGHIGRLASALGLADTWLPIEASWTASLFTDEPGAQSRRLLAPFARILAFSNSESLAASLKRINGAIVCRVPPRPPADQRVHAADHALRQLLECGLLPETDAGILAAPPDAAPPPKNVGSTVTLLHPGAGSPRKRWPLTGFMEVSGLLVSRGAVAEFVIGPAEDDLVPRLEKQAPKLHRPGDLLELLALLRSAGAYIGNDSGVSHLAAWLGLPSVVIFGPSDPVRWQPRGPAVAIVRPPLDCTPCFETAGENCSAPDCLAQVTPANVLEALIRLTRIADLPGSLRLQADRRAKSGKPD